MHKLSCFFLDLHLLKYSELMKMEDYDAEDLNETDEYDYDYTMYQADNLPSIPLAELLTPLLVYSVTYVTGLIGNILILVAVTGQKQVS